MFAAEVRYRAADDLSFLLPADDTVKRLAGIGNPSIRDRETGFKDRESGIQERRLMPELAGVEGLKQV